MKVKYMLIGFVFVGFVFGGGVLLRDHFVIKHGAELSGWLLKSKSVSWALSNSGEWVITDKQYVFLNSLTMPIPTKRLLRLKNEYCETSNRQCLKGLLMEINELTFLNRVDAYGRAELAMKKINSVYSGGANACNLELAVTNLKLEVSGIYFFKNKDPLDVIKKIKSGKGVLGSVLSSECNFNAGYQRLLVVNYVYFVSLLFREAGDADAYKFISIYDPISNIENKSVYYR